MANLREMFSFYGDHGHRCGNSMICEAISGRKPTDYRMFAEHLLREKALL